MVASYVGYKQFVSTVNVVADEAVTLDIQLTQSIQIGEEVVVVGSGTQERSDVTGSVSSVSAEELNKAAITSIDQGLQGRTAGVLVNPTGSKPGSGTEVRIRGTVPSMPATSRCT